MEISLILLKATTGQLKDSNGKQIIESRINPIVLDKLIDATLYLFDDYTQIAYDCGKQELSDFCANVFLVLEQHQKGYSKAKCAPSNDKCLEILAIMSDAFHRVNNELFGIYRECHVDQHQFLNQK